MGMDGMGGLSAGRVTNQMSNQLGGSAGEEKHTLSMDEMPQHTIYSNSNMQGTGTTAGNFGVVGSINTTTVGSGFAHNNMPPYISLHYIIKF